MDVALDRREHDRALAPAVLGLLHVRLEMGDGRLHHLGRLQHERQLHLTGAEELADDLHAGKQRVVDDFQRRAGGERLVEIGFEPGALTVDDPALEPFRKRQRRKLFCARGLRRRQCS